LRVTFPNNRCYGMGLIARASRPGPALKAMQPMQLHWAPCLWRPRAMVFG